MFIAVNTNWDVLTLSRVTSRIYENLNMKFTVFNHYYS